MASHIVGYPRMGPKRELKFALESFWDGKSSAETLKKVSADLRSSIWKQMADAGIKYIPSNTFSYYDQRKALLSPAMEMTKWFDTTMDEYKEAKLGVNTVPVLVGPVSYLLLSKLKGVEKSFPLLSLDKILFRSTRVVDGRNIWANDLAASLDLLQSLEGIVGKLVVSTSCSLLHTAVDLINEPKLDDEIKSWLAFAAQKVAEANALPSLSRLVPRMRYFSLNAAAQASRKSSLRVTNEAVQKASAALQGSDHLVLQNTVELRRVRREYKAKKISEEEYVKAIKEEIKKVVDLQEELDIDVLVHGEPGVLVTLDIQCMQRNDMVEYFGEQLSGFAFTANGWVQSYGSRRVKPPIIYGDVSRPNLMTVSGQAQLRSMTKRPMKGMLTGPVTILNWSFVRNDQPRFETCYQIALAIKDEVEDLEKAGINVIQIDEAVF
ncbi:hypothetical protein HAX54_013663 [Datura stramonium]|uniref:5-methyltetrahydropteroyltriglutamate--homocysteine S-methyltransferase n=1 Tax=Datura stramonium TaxID=4076 RepID=A0ABS8TNL0_DATST|nr:hypothetical protein [Datura stramonium]